MKDTETVTLRELLTRLHFANEDLYELTEEDLKDNPEGCEKVISQAELAIIKLIESEPCLRCGNSKYEKTPADMLPSIVDAIEFRREQYGWNKGQMAEALGWHKSDYSMFIIGERKLPFAIACRAFSIGVPAAVLLQEQALSNSGVESDG